MSAAAVMDVPDGNVALWFGADTRQKKFVGVSVVTRSEKLSY